MTCHSLTAAVWTPPGRGAVATIRVQGDLAELSEGIVDVFRAASGRSLTEIPLQQISFGQWSGTEVRGQRPEIRDSSEVAEDVVLCRTHPDVCEIHCHGGDAAVRRILSDLVMAGCVVTEWDRQLESERGVFECGHAFALSQASTLRAAGWIASQAGRMERIIAELNELVANGQRDVAAAEANDVLEWASFGRHLTRPWNVVLAGRPNVGKSSLINALVGFERSIVFDEPGTTRDVVTADTVLDGWAIRLSDTAGQRGSAKDLEAEGIAKARGAFADADARLLLVDVSQPPHDDDRQLLTEWPDSIVVAHKSDLPDVWEASLPASAIRVSSLRGTGLTELSLAIVTRLVPKLPPEDAIIPLNDRQVLELMAFQKTETADG